MATDFSGGVKTVTASAAALAGAKEVLWLTLRSINSNGQIMLGASGVTATAGFALLPGEIVRFGTCDLGDVYLIGTAGDKLWYVYGSTTA